MLELKEAIRLCDLAMGETLEDEVRLKISKDDRGKTGWHVGKWEFIVILSKIYDVEPGDIQFKKRERHV